MPRPRNTVENMMRYVDKTSSCWLWNGPLASNGYSKTKYRLKHTSGHRAFYLHFRGEIPPGMHLDHICRVRSCVNPDHLEIVTPRENLLRGNGHAAINSKKKSCKRGHELAGKNLYLTPDGRRNCKICRSQPQGVSYP